MLRSNGLSLLSGRPLVLPSLISATPSFTWAVLKSIIVETELTFLLARVQLVDQSPFTSLLVVLLVSTAGPAMDLVLTVYSPPL